MAAFSRQIRSYLLAGRTAAVFGAAAILFSSALMPAEAAGENNFGVTRSLVMHLVGNFGQARDLILAVVMALPVLPAEVARCVAAIFASAQQHGSVAPLFLALAVSALLIALPRLLLFVPFLRRLRPPTPFHSLPQAAKRLALDLVDLAVMMVVAVVAVDALFHDDALFQRFCLAVIDTTIRVRLAMFIPLALLRPGESALRLIPANDRQVDGAIIPIWVVVGLGAGFITLIPVLFEAGIPQLHEGDQPWRAGQALAVVVGTLVSLGGLWAVLRFFQNVASSQPRLYLAAKVLVAVFWLAWSYGVISLDFDFYYTFVGLSVLAALTLLVDRFLQLATQQSREIPDEGDRSLMAYAGALCRCARMASAAVALVLLARYVLSQALLMYSVERWASIESGLVYALIYILAGYVAFELLRVWTRVKFGVRVEASVPGSNDEEEAQPASRLTTVMPLVQGFVGITILGVAVIAALSELGVNITPLLAGAGIFGLAISFGSQSLVRDIVAGLFYMFDDAFRVDEYIEAGRLRGTVERISLRSLRLRHQNGQMHTIPFGQLGSITNHSRDWITVKFNLRFAPDTDLEKLRKLVKRIGQDMLGDAEIGREFLLPLKMQGVADVVENSLVLRFKFTVRPGKPTIVQREALKRMVLAFRTNNITFATPAVAIRQPEGASPDELPAEGTAAAGATVIKAAKTAAEATAAQ